MSDSIYTEDYSIDQQRAEIIAELISGADGGCSACVSELAKQAAKIWPEFEWEKMALEFLYREREPPICAKCLLPRKGNTYCQDGSTH